MIEVKNKQITVSGINPRLGDADDEVVATITWRAVVCDAYES